MSQKNKSQRRSAKTKKDTLTAISEIPTVDIYDSLFHKETLQTTLSELENLVDQDTQGKDNGFEISILNLFLQLCGIDPKKTSVNQIDIPNSIKRIFERLYDEPEALEQIEELLLIDKNTKDHRKLNVNLKEFWELLFSNKTEIVADSKLLSFLIQWIPIFSNSKVRSIRVVSAEILSIVVSQAIVEIKEDHQARKFKKFIYDIYHNILKQRIRDVDLNIRSKILATISKVLIEMPQDFLTQNEMTQIFTTLILDKSADNNRLAVTSLQKIYNSKIQLSVPLVSYANVIMDTLLQESYHNSKLSYQYLVLLSTLKSYSSSIAIPEAKVRELFCGLLKTSASASVIKQITQIYMKTLYPDYSEKPEKETLSKMGDRNFLSVIISKIPSALTQNQKELMFGAIVDFSRGLFDIDELFLMMITETLQSAGSQKPMSEPELQNSLILIRAYIKNVTSKEQTKAEKECDYKHNVMGIFNKRVLVYCKEIFYDKIGKHPSLTLDYIRLFGLLSSPLPSSFETYLQIIIDQLSHIFAEATTLQIMTQITSVFKKVSRNSIDLLVRDVDASEVERVSNPIAVFKCAAIVGQFNVPKFVRIEVLAGLAANFERVSETTVLMAIMSILNHSHAWLFKELTTEATEQSFKVYVEYRQIYMRFLEFALTHPNQKCRQSAFSLSCNTLTLVMNNRLQQAPILLYKPREEFVTAIYKYLTQSNLEDLNTSFQQLSIRSTLNIGCHRMVESVLKLCANSVRFSILECSIEFILTLLNSEDKVLVNKTLAEMAVAEASKDNQNVFIFWRVVRQIIPRAEKLKVTMQALLDIYFTKKSDAKLLLNKLILFVAETIEQGFNQANQKFFIALQPILKKVSRKCQKMTFSKINAFFLSKLSAAHEQFQKIAPVKKVKVILSKYAGSVVKKEEKMEEERNSDASSAGQEEKERSQSDNGSQKAHSQNQQQDDRKENESESRDQNSERGRSYPKRNRSKK